MKPLASNEEVGTRLLVRILDLCSLSSVRAFVEGLEREGLLKRLDLLILNAGGPGIKLALICIYFIPVYILVYEDLLNK